MYESCCKTFLFRLPYGTITASLMAVCGVIISGCAVTKATKISEKLFFDLFQRNYLWFNDLKVLYMISGVVICIAILMNIILGFAATGHKLPRRDIPTQSGCCGYAGAAASATNFLVRFMFILNYFLYHWLLLATLIATASFVLCYQVSSLCTDGKTISTCSQTHTSPYLNSVSDVDGAGASNGRIDLRQFAPLLRLAPNETDFLLMEGVRLKKLCHDYMKELYLNIILTFFGCLLLIWAFLNFLINLSVNYAKISTKRKYAELMYINSAEMVAFAER